MKLQSRNTETTWNYAEAGDSKAIARSETVTGPTNKVTRDAGTNAATMRRDAYTTNHTAK